MVKELAMNAAETDLTLIQIAREIAINHYDMETILKQHGVSHVQWEKIKTSQRFTTLLDEEIREWQSAINTHERTKLKAAAMVEEWLPEANTRMHDMEETLPSKVELAKLVARVAGMGLTNTGIDGAIGERFSVTINLGDDKKLTFEKDVTPKVIEGSDDG